MNSRKTEKAASLLFIAAAAVSIASVLTICVFLFAKAIPALQEIGAISFLLGKKWQPSNEVFGIFPMILGSFYVTALAGALGMPIGIFTAVYLSSFASPAKRKLIEPAVNLLAGIPSVVYGFFGLVVIVPFIQNIFGGTGSSMLAASVLLGIMILPTIITVSLASLRAVPPLYYEGARALGASHEQSIFGVVVPAAKSGIIAGIVLGTGRAIGETMAVIMVAGNQARMPAGLLKGIRTMTANIVIEMGYASGLHREALIATAAVLFVFILLINVLFSLLKAKVVKHV